MKTLKKTKVFDLLETLGTKGVLTRKDILFAMNEFSDKRELRSSDLAQYIYGTGYYCTSSVKELRKLKRVGKGLFKIVVDELKTPPPPPPALTPEQLQEQHLQRRLNNLCKKHYQDPRNTYYGTRPYAVSTSIENINPGICYYVRINSQFYPAGSDFVTISEDLYIEITGTGPKDIKFPTHPLFGERITGN